MNKKVLLVIIFVFLFIINYLLVHFIGLGLGFSFGISPSPYDPSDASKKCSYQNCYDKCLKRPFKETPCLQIGCVCPNTDQYYCVYKDNQCIKKAKPKCIVFKKYYFCTDLKFYEFKGMNDFN